MIVPLPRKFVSRHGTPAIDRLDTEIFEYRYFTHCMECSFCHDKCCSWGADVDVENVARLRAVAADFTKYSGIPEARWFADDFSTDAEFPGGRFTRPRIADGACVFRNRTARGCGIHTYCLDRKIDYHDLKPMICTIFPLTFDGGLLHAMTEIKEKSLICQGEGPTIYRGVRDEIEYYFGGDCVRAIDALEARA